MLAARAYDKCVLDGVHFDLNDQDGLEQSCRRGVEMGFDGKTLIHPKQCDAANRAFAPSEEQVLDAKGIIEANAAALAEGKGVTMYNGRLVENLHVEAAKRTQAVAQAIGEREKTWG